MSRQVRKEGRHGDVLPNDNEMYIKRRANNFKPGRGYSRQTTGQIDFLPPNEEGEIKPTGASRKKFLRLSKEKDTTKGNRTKRQQYKDRLETLRAQNNGYLHARDNWADIRGINNNTTSSQKEGWAIAVRPLMSYSERNVDEKKCKYGAFKDGSRYRCAQNLNHKEGGGGNVRDHPTQNKKDGSPDLRTQLDQENVNKKRKIRRADQPDDDDDDGGGGQDFGDYGGGDDDDDDDDDEAPDAPRRETEAERKKRVKIENAKKKMGDYLKAGLNVRIPKGKIFAQKGKKYSK